MCSYVSILLTSPVNMGHRSVDQASLWIDVVRSLGTGEGEGGDIISQVTRVHLFLNRRVGFGRMKREMGVILKSLTENTILCPTTFEKNTFVFTVILGNLHHRAYPSAIRPSQLWIKSRALPSPPGSGVIDPVPYKCLPAWWLGRPADGGEQGKSYSLHKSLCLCLGQRTPRHNQDCTRRQKQNTKQRPGSVPPEQGIESVSPSAGT